MLRKLVLASVVGFGLLVPAVISSSAEAREWHRAPVRAYHHESRHYRVPVFRPRFPVYVAPAPVYVAPVPVYVQPAPVCVPPA
jgi:hypothetical protein